ncbi:CCA tRNA nucleotidyltransferase [Pelagibacterales bacterium SAG-MED39]|nr:CCA tRNA nucleotidyltransferase [Pelagibacterales bacterium SAG-MED39]
MKSLLNTIFFRSNNLDYISKNIKDLTTKTFAHKIFEAINSFSSESEVRYVGGCIRKIINKEKVDDIDLATNLEPEQVCESLKRNNINYFETGIDHGTVTAILNEQKFEITTLREDIFTDGRHAKVKFTKNWKEDSIRRDFTINSIYSDPYGNIFDPHDGKKDLENGVLKFIGNADQRVKEDYLRILRYIRFYINYSKQPHNIEIIKKLKMNIGGISKLSKERLLNELKKMSNLNTLEKLTKDKISLELIQMIFPELKNINIFSKLNSIKKEIFNEVDFIFLLSLMIIDTSDNTDYFLYKFNISKKDHKRIKIIDNFYREKIRSNRFTENNMNKIFYYNGKQAVIDILNFTLIKSKKFDINLKKLIELYKKKSIPIMPISAHTLMTKYNVPHGKKLGEKLKTIEEEWVKNNFKISDQQVDTIVNF